MTSVEHRTRARVFASRREKNGRLWRPRIPQRQILVAARPADERGASDEAQNRSQGHVDGRTRTLEGETGAKWTRRCSREMHERRDTHLGNQVHGARKGWRYRRSVHLSVLCESRPVLARRVGRLTRGRRAGREANRGRPSNWARRARIFALFPCSQPDLPGCTPCAFSFHNISSPSNRLQRPHVLVFALRPQRSSKSGSVRGSIASRRARVERLVR